MTDISIMLSTIVVLVSILLFIYHKKRSRLNNAMAKIPGPKSLPFFGNALSLVGSRETFIAKFIKLVENHLELGLASLWFGPNAHVFLFKAEFVEVLLSNTKHLDKAHDYDFLQPWLNFGLITSSGEKWRHRRRLLTPAFHFRILNDFLPSVNEKCEIFVQVLEKEVGTPSFDLFPYISRVALDIICETAMGCSVNAQTDGKSEYVNAVHASSKLLFSRMVLPWLEPDFVFYRTKEGKEFVKSLKVLKGFTKEVIKKRKEDYIKSGKKISETDAEDSLYGKKKRLAFLDLLFEYSDEGRVLTEEDIQEEVDTFMFAGHDTTSAGIFWSIYFMGLYPEIQENVYQEIMDVIGDSSVIESEHLTQLKYLEAALKESLRLCPPVPIIGRKISEDFPIENYVMPAGATIGVMTYILHRDPKQFPNPEIFDPERFLGDNKSRHPYAFVPFSAGQRNCIGQKFALMEEKTVMVYFLRNYKVSVVKDKPGHYKVVPEIIMRPASGIELKIERRE